MAKIKIGQGELYATGGEGRVAFVGTVVSGICRVNFYLGENGD